MAESREVRQLAKIVSDHSRQIRGLSGGPQLAYSSIENGALNDYDAAGTLRGVIGKQHDGTHTTTVVNGPRPPQPTLPVVTPDHGSLTVRWDGAFASGAVAPADWSRVEVQASTDPDFVPAPVTAHGSIVSAAGGETTFRVPPGSWTVCLVAWSQAGKFSEPSERVTVEVKGFGEIVLAEIDAADTVIRNASELLVDAQATLGEKLSGLDGAGEAIADIRDTVLPGLREDLDSAEGRLGEAEADLIAARERAAKHDMLGWNPKVLAPHAGVAGPYEDAEHGLTLRLDGDELVFGSGAVALNGVEGAWDVTPGTRYFAQVTLAPADEPLDPDPDPDPPAPEPEPEPPTPVAPSIRAVTAVDFASTGANRTVPVPAGTQAGDLLVLIASADYATVSNFQPPAGFTRINARGHGSNQLTLITATRVATESEPASYTMSVPQYSDARVDLLAVRDAGTTPVVVSASTPSSATAHAAPSVTPTSDRGLLVCAAAMQSVSGNVVSFAWEPPADMVEVTDRSALPYVSQASASQAWESTDPTGPRAFTLATTAPARAALTVSILIPGKA